MSKLVSAAAIAVTMLAGSASAASFDFLSAGGSNTYLGSTTLALAEGTLTSGGTDLYVNQGGANSICSIGGSSCAADLTVDFNGLASNITFSTMGWALGDTFEVSLYDSMNALLESQVINTQGTFSFASMGVASMFFDDSSTQAGVHYEDWSFDLAPVSAVPLPAGAVLLLTGIGALGLRRRKTAA